MEKTLSEKAEASLAAAALTARTHSLWLLKGLGAENLRIARGCCAYLAEHGAGREAEVAGEFLRDSGSGTLDTAWAAVFGVGRGSVTPQQSVIEYGLSMEASRDATRDFMLRYGVTPEKTGEPEDHLGIQLEFLALLIERFLGNRDPETIRAALRFADAHLSWTGNLMRDAREKFQAACVTDKGIAAVLSLLELSSRFAERVPGVLRAVSEEMGSP